MKSVILFLFALFYLISSQSLGLFHEQFLKEINTFKPVIDDKALFKIISKYSKTFKIEESRTVKTVDLNNIYETCSLDFEVKLVQSETLPASDHQIAHINIGGLIVPGQTPKFTNFWAATIGVVIKNLGEKDSVYSLLYHLKLDFNKYDFMRYSGLDLTDIDERVIVDYIFYNECYRIYEEELLPVKG